eukprot:8592269-Alexandrium_andersonii.AAC.1
MRARCVLLLAGLAGWLRCGPPLRASECRRLSQMVAECRRLSQTSAVTRVCVRCCCCCCAALARLGASMLAAAA